MLEERIQVEKIIVLLDSSESKDMKSEIKSVLFTVLCPIPNIMPGMH